jgi:hypothetical protein
MALPISNDLFLKPCDFLIEKIFNCFLKFNLFLSLVLTTAENRFKTLFPKSFLNFMIFIMLSRLAPLSRLGRLVRLLTFGPFIKSIGLIFLFGFFFEMSL